MVRERKASLDRALGRYAVVAEDASVTRVAAALQANGITVLRAADAGKAKQLVLELIPPGSQVHHGASVSLSPRASSLRSRAPAGTSRSSRGSGAWTAKSKPTKSGASRRPRT